MTCAADLFAAQGFVRVAGFMPAGAIPPCRAICDRVLDLWRQEHREAKGQKVTNIAYLTEARYFAGREDDLVALLELVADPRILDLLRAIGFTAPRFHNTQYFMESDGPAWDGNWHRDTQFMAPDAEVERRRLTAGGQSVHFRIAFVDDGALDYVPGSERRWDSAAELAVRRTEAETVRRGADMPGAVALPLGAGDALLFHAWGIHRGRYAPQPVRRTLDIIYTDRRMDWSPPAAAIDPETIARLRPEARDLFT